MLSSSGTFVISSPLYYSHSDCGYCEGKKEKFLGLKLPAGANAPKQCLSSSVGTHVEQMTCQHYDFLINRNFRRSGNFLYKGDMLRGCCRMYTIRTDLGQMKITKEHRQVVNRFKRAIRDDKQSTQVTTNSKKGESFELVSLIRAEQQSLRFRTRYEPAVFSKEKFELYKKYQVRVHNDNPKTVSESSFNRFLCQSPFTETELEGTPEQWLALNSWTKNWPHHEKCHRLGPTHECYYLDEKLIAISVLDFLPSGLSSVYFIWDPDYAHLSLGTLLGIREIQMCKELGLGYYYLGYYIEDCAKMRYKGKFGGEVLDVCNGAYAPLERIKPFLHDGKFFTLSELDSSEISEKELDFLEMPIKWSSDYVDASEAIYGLEKTYDDAKKTKDTLAQKLHLADPKGNVNMELPDVFPGCLPLHQILTLFENLGDIDLPVRVYDYERNALCRSFSHLPARLKCAAVDCIRLFGVEMFLNSIMYG